VRKIGAPSGADGRAGWPLASLAFKCGVEARGIVCHAPQPQAAAVTGLRPAQDAQHVGKTRGREDAAKQAAIT